MWHFVDRPINWEGLGFDNPILENNNALYAINNTITVLNDSGHDVTVEKSMMIRTLIHTVGDIHQPLHSSSFFSKEFPNGDRGGNLYNVQYKNKTVKWHILWDS